MIGDIEDEVAEWMALATLVLGVQWSQVWDLPLWLWRQYVDICEERVKEAGRG